MSDEIREAAQAEIKRLLDEAAPTKDNGKPLECRLCPLYDAPGPVAGEGPTDGVKIFLLGEAPGETEVLLHRPFIGGSGRILNRMLAKTGIQRSTCYVTNVVKCRPTVVTHEGQVKDRPPSNTEIECCARFLVAELESVKPNLIVGLGGTALLVLRDTNAIGKYRGVPFETAFGKALCTYHPAGLMRRQSLFPLALRDLSLAVKEAKTKELVRVEVSYNTSASAARDGASLIEAARRTGFVTLDLETTGLDPRSSQIVCCGAGTEPQKASCYAWNADSERLIRGLYEDPNIAKVGQNCEGFDWWYLAKKGFPEAPAGRSYDTLLMFHLTNSDLPKDLGTLGSVYTDMDYWKDKGKGLWKKGEEAKPTLFEYNCQDVDGTTRSFVTLREEIRRLGLEDLLHNSVMPLQPVLRRMSDRGLRKDEQKAAEWSLAMGMVADEKEEVLRQGLGRMDFSVNSPKQLMHLLYEELGLPVQYVRDKERGSRPTANDEAMEALALITNDPIFLQVNEIRTLRKYKATYCDVETDENGFMHPRFGCAKAANGRLNSWDPNAQNWPEDLRELVVPDTPEHMFVSADWSQIEWIINMILTADPVGLEMAAKHVDNHAVVAAECFGIPMDSVNQNIPDLVQPMSYRHAAKFIVYGLGYGRGAESIARQLGKEKPWVEAFIGRFFRKFRVFSNARDRWEAQVRQHNFLRNPFGRRRWWYSMQVPELYNFLPSSTAADMMYITIPRVERDLPAGSTLRLTVHDELVVCALRDQTSIRSSVQVLLQHMQSSWPMLVEASDNPKMVRNFFPSGWTPVADFALGNTWKDCKNKAFQKTEGLRLKKEYGLEAA